MKEKQRMEAAVDRLVTAIPVPKFGTGGHQKIE